MLSNLQIAFALSGKVHGDGVLAPGPGKGPDDISLSIVPNAAGDDIIVSPAACRVYVEEMLDQAQTEPPIAPEVTQNLLPNIADINAHLSNLFAPAFVHAYSESKIEIAYGHAASGNQVNQAKIFSAFDLEKAAAFAERKNRDGHNIYVGPALRSEQHKLGRANSGSVITAAFAWAEYDGAGDAERIYEICKTHLLWPAIVVNTGTIPNRRDHLYFAVDGVPTPADLAAMNTALKEVLGSDAVQDASRVMRLAGTINHPSPKKAADGYVPELVTLRLVPDSARYSIGTLTNLAAAHRAACLDHFGDHVVGIGNARRDDDEIEALLKASRIGNWHNNIRNAVASMIGRDWSDMQIRLACAQYCTGGANDRDLAVLIEGGRNKWDKRDHNDDDGYEDEDAAEPNLKESDERIANQAPVAANLPVLHITPRISLLATRTQEMLITAGVPFYQRGGELVRPIIRAVKAAHGRLTRTALLKSVVPIFMRDTMCRHARWKRFDQRSGRWLDTMAPMTVATTLLERDGVWRFQEIVGVIATPTMRPDGSLLLKKGYDAATRLLLIEPPKMPEIPDHPTREDALKALALLEDLISESPFDDEASKAVALSALITPVVRGAFAVAPMHVSSAPVAGSGKSFLWDLVAAISAGQRRIPVIAAGNAEETEKRLVGVMLSGQPLISIDNVNGELKGDFLCQAIEQHVLDIRPLGRSEIARIETGGVTFFATGNNITIVGDLCRRTITSRLDSKLENPQFKQFKNDPIGKILDDRGAYIAACLTICRAYIVAGRPGLLPRLASFEGWSDTVRSALVWLGKADAVETMEGIRAEDPQRATLSDFLHAWAKDHGTGSGSDVTLAVIIEKSMKMNNMGGFDDECRFPDLNAAVRAAASTGGKVFGAKVDPLVLGIWCRANKGRIVDGLRLANKLSTRGGAATWWVEKI
jgi:putative DNA primase/helicase